MSGDLRLTLPASLSAPRDARAALRPWLRSHHCSPEQAEAAELLTSELVSNAVLHTPSSVVTVSADVTDDNVRVGVGDCLPDVRPPVTPQMSSGPQRDGGRGLLLVEAMSATWGTDRRSEGKEVWFEMPCDASGDSTSHCASV